MTTYGLGQQVDWCVNLMATDMRSVQLSLLQVLQEEEPEVVRKAHELQHAYLMDLKKFTEELKPTQTVMLGIALTLHALEEMQKAQETGNMEQRTDGSEYP